MPAVVCRQPSVRPRQGHCGDAAGGGSGQGQRCPTDRGYARTWRCDGTPQDTRQTLTSRGAPICRAWAWPAGRSLRRERLLSAVGGSAPGKGSAF